MMYNDIENNIKSNKKNINMALIICPECGKQISDKADACIHCGYPLKKEKSSSRIDLSVLSTNYEENAKRKLVESSYKKYGWIPFLW